MWVEVLLDKYLCSQSTSRLLGHFAHWGLRLSQGTVTGGLKRFALLAQAMREKQLSERLRHADETGWKVFETMEGKVGNRWYLWVTRSPSVVHYRMAPGRAVGALQRIGAGAVPRVSRLRSCDRYSAYKKLAKQTPNIVLAYCWTHQRRDFLEAANQWPELADWMHQWVEDIGDLCELNKSRLATGSKGRRWVDNRWRFAATTRPCGRACRG